MLNNIMYLLFIILLTFNLKACNTNSENIVLRKKEIDKNKQDVVEQIFNNYDKLNKNSFLSLQEFYNFLSVCDRTASKKNFELWITGMLYYDSFF